MWEYPNDRGRDHHSDALQTVAQHVDERGANVNVLCSEEVGSASGRVIRTE
jgi:hypothetical protein